MLNVELNNIVTNDELAQKADDVLRRVDEQGQIVVVTRNGRPAVALIKIEQLEELSGRTVTTEHPAHGFMSPAEPMSQDFSQGPLQPKPVMPMDEVAPAAPSFGAEPALQNVAVTPPDTMTSVDSQPDMPAIPPMESVMPMAEPSTIPPQTTLPPEPTFSQPQAEPMTPPLSSPTQTMDPSGLPDMPDEL